MRLPFSTPCRNSAEWSGTEFLNTGFPKRFWHGRFRAYSIWASNTSPTWCLAETLISGHWWRLGLMLFSWVSAPGRIIVCVSKVRIWKVALRESIFSPILPYGSRKSPMKNDRLWVKNVWWSAVEIQLSTVYAPWSAWELTRFPSSIVEPGKKCRPTWLKLKLPNMKVLILRFSPHLPVLSEMRTAMSPDWNIWRWS